MSRHARIRLFFDDVSRRWRELAERRRDHYVELYESGRWRLYYKTRERFVERLRGAIEAADVWDLIAAPRPVPDQATAKVEPRPPSDAVSPPSPPGLTMTPSPAPPP